MKIFEASMLLFCLTACVPNEKKRDRWESSAPAVNRYTSIDRGGETILPNGRIITPSGKQITVAPHPFGLSVSPDGKVIVTANSGVGPFSVSIIKNYNEASPEVKQIPDNTETKQSELDATFMGLAISSES